jgi:hypothetical protein
MNLRLIAKAKSAAWKGAKIFSRITSVSLKPFTGFR